MRLFRLFPLFATLGLAIALVGCSDEDSLCSPSAIRSCVCQSGGQGSQRCNISGTAWGECTGCPEDCTPGDKRCRDNVVEVCSATGDAYQEETICTFNEICTAGACVPATCGNGSCEIEEGCQRCPEDCGSCCGDGSCDAALGETLASCPEDCTVAPAHRWAMALGGEMADDGRAITVDGAGNLIVVGRFVQRLPLDSDTTLLPAGSAPNVFVAKYSPTRALLWARALAGPAEIDVADVVTDGQGNIYLAGSFVKEAAFGGTGVILRGSTETTPHLWVAKLAPNSSLVWSNTAGGEGTLSPRAIAVDGSGNVVVGGEITGNVSFDTTTFSVGGELSIFVARYDSAGTLSWARGADSMSITTNPAGAYVAFDDAGDIYVAGTFGPGDLTLGSTTLAASVQNVFLAKLAKEDGAASWAKALPGVASTSFQEKAVARSLLVKDGSAIVAGFFRAQRMEIGSSLLSSKGQHHDGFVASFSTAGDAQWALSLAASARLEIFDVAADSSGDLIVAGLAEGALSLGATSTTTQGRAILVARIDSNQQLAFAELADGAGGEHARSVTALGGKLYLTGTLEGACSFGGETLSPAGSSDAFVWHLALP